MIFRLFSKHSSKSKSEIQLLKKAAFYQICRILDCKKIIETRSTLRKKQNME